MNRAHRGNQSFQKAANAALVMREIRLRAPVSRTEIAQRTGLTKSTVSTIVGDLLEAGALRENRRRTGAADSRSGRTGSRGGRPRSQLALRESCACVLGLDLRRSGFEAVMLDLSGRRIDGWEGEGPEADPGDADAESQAAADPVRLFLAAYERITARISRASPPILGIGVGIPGYVDPVSGTVLRSTRFAAEDLPFSLPVSHEIGIPVLIENDANCVAWGEIAAGGERDAGDRNSDRDREHGMNLLTVLLTLRRDAQGRVSPEGTGIGCGVVMDGDVRYGNRFAAGEYRGSAWRIGRPGQLGIDPAAVLPEHLRKREILVRLLADLAPVVSLLSPERVVCAGDLLDLEAEIRLALAGPLAGSAVDPGVSGAPVLPARYRRHAVAAGAAAMVLERMFRPPEIGMPRPAGLPDWDRLIARLRDFRKRKGAVCSPE